MDDKAVLTEAFHCEMRELAKASNELTQVSLQYNETGRPEDIKQGTTPEARIVSALTVEYLAAAEDLHRRFSEAEIGEWNDHLAASGAKAIFDHGLKLDSF